MQASLAGNLQATVSLGESIRGLADEISAEQDWRQAIANGIAWVEVPAIGAFTPAQTPYAQGGWGPPTGYAWAVQRITVGPLAAGDNLEVYRGHSTADASGNQNFLNAWISPSAQQQPVQAWNPGRTGCLLNPRQTLIFTGTLTGGPYYANADVISIETWLLPYFLL